MPESNQQTPYGYARNRRPQTYGWGVKGACQCTNLRPRGPPPNDRVAGGLTGPSMKRLVSGRKFYRFRKLTSLRAESQIRTAQVVGTNDHCEPEHIRHGRADET